ncbi:MAG: hypothetical protein IJU44_03970 [Kiritimatiellae bacterium]|nr:hypothetical protein [Kiritimatiellia bacterium]
MANLIEATKIEGASVYGVAQVGYTVDGVPGKDYAAALTAAAFKETTAIETAVAGYAEVVRQRIRKLDDLGGIMSALNYAVANLKVKDTESSDSAWVPNSAWVNSTAKKYGITLVFKENSADMTRANLYKGQNEVQYATDREDNDLKQDTVSLNSYISKRDNAFSAASKLVKKANNAASNTIGNIGG